MRRFIVYFVLIACAGGVAWMYFSLSDRIEEYGDPFRITPTDITVLTEIDFSIPADSYLPWISSIASRGDEVENVSFNPLVILPRCIEVIDSLRRNDEYWNPVLNNSPVLLANSAPLTEDRWMLIVPATADVTEVQANHLVQLLTGVTDWKQRDFHGKTLHESEKMGYVILNSCISISPIASLREACVLTNELNNPVTLQDAFVRARSCRAADCPMHFYYALGNADWLEMDPQVRNGERKLSGFACLAPGSKNRWQMSQLPGTTEIASYLPANTIIAEGYIHPSFESGWNARELQSSGTQEEKYWSQAWKALGDSCACDLNESVLGWQGGEWGSCILQSPGQSTSEILYISISDTSRFLEKIRPIIADTVGSHGYFIHRIRYPQAFDRNKSSLFLVSCNYVLQQGNFAFFAAIPEDLYAIADARIAGTLNDASTFKEVAPMGINGGHFIFHASYLTSDLPVALIQSFGVTGPMMALVSRFSDSQLDVQIRFPNGEAVNGSGTSTNRNNGDIWSMEFKTAITGGPWRMKNHNTNGDEVLVQDASNEIHLVGNDGKELWNLALDGPIISDPVQVDALKNGKLQMAFNTAKSIYVLDRLGRPLNGFPVALPSIAAGPMSVFDYDHNRSYRFVVGCEDGMLYNYGIDGTKTKGWNYTNENEKILFTDHLRLGSDDYIVTTSNQGTIRFLKRSGEVRKDLSVQVNHMQPQRPAILPGMNIGSTMILAMTEGNEVAAFVLEKKGSTLLGPKGSSHTYSTFFDVNGDHKEDVLTAEKNHLVVTDAHGKKLLDVDLPSEAMGNPSVLRLSTVDIRYVIPIEGNKVLLLNTSGESVGELVSSAQLASGDFNGNSLPDVVRAEGKLLVVK